MGPGRIRSAPQQCRRETTVKLFYSASSPFVRKVVICAMLRGLEGRIENHVTNPHESPKELLAANPLSKVPCLVTDDGVGLFDSPVICEYLDSIGDAAPLFPPAGPGRVAALRMQALGDGMMDAAVARRGQMALPQDDGRKAFDARQKSAVERSLALLEQNSPRGLGDIGAITVACALGYLDFRFGAEPWRDAHPKLAAWYAAAAAEPAMAKTVPPAA
jgi:glutathione S-transferase